MEQDNEHYKKGLEQGQQDRAAGESPYYFEKDGKLVCHEKPQPYKRIVREENELIMARGYIAGYGPDRTAN